MASLLRRLVARYRKRGYDVHLKEELRIHEEMAREDAERRGAIDPSTEARRSLGNTLQAKEDARAVWIAPRLDGVFQDVRLAFRQMRRAPVFASTAITMSALGIGVLAIVFSVVNLLFLVPLPFPDSTRILTLITPDGGGVDGVTFHATKARLGDVATVAAQRRSPGWNFAVGNQAEYIGGLRVSAQFFDVLGVQPAIGRAFSATEDTAGGPDAVILSFDLWQRMLQGRSDAVGQVVSLGGTPHEVIGIMPEGFRSVPPADAFVPLRLSPVDNTLNYLLLIRFRDQVSEQQSAALLNVVRADLVSAYPESAHRRIRSLQWSRLQDTIGREPLLLSLILTVAVAFVVIVACTNIAGLQLLRTMARQHEIAARMAIGGGRSRIVQQLLTESLVLGGVGGIVGMLLAAGSMPVLNRLLPPELLVGRALGIDWRVMAFGVLLTTGISMFFGLAPAITVWRVELRHVLATNQRTGGTKAGGWWRRGLLVSQLAATMALLVIAGTLVDYVRQMYGASLGFDPRGVVIAKMSLQGKSFEDPAQVQAFADRALSQLQRLPGVRNVALANHVPVERGLNLTLQPPFGSRIDKMRAVDWRSVTPDYFPALGIAVRKGRALAMADRGATPVAVVNEAFARAYFGPDDPIGKVISLAPSMSDPAREIVGVVADVRSRPGTGWTRGFTALGSDPPPTVYVAFHQMPKTVLAIVQRTFPMVWIVRTSGDATGSVERQMSEALSALDQQTPLIQVQPMSAIIASDISTPRVMMLAVVGFGTVALLISCIGIYGLVAYSASQKSRETAVRIALGANRLALIRAFLVETSLIAAIGVSIGLMSMLALSGVLRATLGSLASIDLETVVAITALLLSVLAAAGYVPARRAAGVDPLASLRQD